MLAKFKATTKTAAAIAAILMPLSAVAATQGTLGLTSSGSMDIGVEKNYGVKITGLDDVDLGDHSAISDVVTGSESFCVFSSTGFFRLTITSSHGDTEQMLMKSTASETNPNSETLAYYVYGGLNGSNGGDNPAIINGAPNSGLFGDSSDENCSNGSNTDISFAILPADFNAASPGVYSDTLTMFVEPE